LSTVPGAYARQLLELAARWEVSSELLLADLDLTPELLASPHMRLEFPVLDEMVRRARALTGEPGLGFYMGMQLRISSHGYLGFAAMTAGTVGEALALAERFIHTRAPTLALRSYIEGEDASVVLEERAELGGDLREFVVTAALVTIVYAALFITGRELTGTAEVTFPAPDYYDRFAHLLPGRVRFSQPSNRLLFSRSILDLPLVMADPVATSLAREQCERELVALGAEDHLVARVRSAIEQDGAPTLEEVARAMHVSPRTLKRQLAAHGTTYSQLLEEIRRDRALLLLQNRALTIESIAEKLGYSDVTSFARAFRRWTGKTPASVRR
jgi:AraC-like DNA-binding protein